MEYKFEDTEIAIGDRLVIDGGPAHGDIRGVVDRMLDHQIAVYPYIHVKYDCGRTGWVAPIWVKEIYKNSVVEEEL